MSLGGSKLKKRAATRRKQMKQGKGNKPQQQQQQQKAGGGKRQGAGKKQFRKAAAMAQAAPQHQQHPTGKLTRAQKQKLARKQRMNAGVQEPMMMTGRRGGGGGGDQIQTLKQRLAALERTVVIRRGAGAGGGRGGGGGGGNAMSPRELQLKNRVADLERELRASRQSVSPAVAFVGGLRTGAAFAMVADRIPEQFCIAPNTCLGHSSSRLLQRFEAGLAECGVAVTDLAETALEDLSLGFHGTASPQAILMDGFDPAKRNRQFKGRGEYFSAKWEDAERFARRAAEEGNGDEPTVLVTLLIKSQADNVQLDNDPSTSWLCVNNPMGRNSPTFCLPVCYVRLNDTSVALPDCPPYDGSSGRQQAGGRIVEYSADRNQWVRFPRGESRRITSAWSSGSRCVVTIGGQRYSFDWQAGRIVSDNGDWYHFQMQQ